MRKYLLTCALAIAMALIAAGMIRTPAYAKDSEEVVPVYRLYNESNLEHLYTTSYAEYQNCVSVGWKDEGIGWYAPKTSNWPVRRLYHAPTGYHLYSQNPIEMNMLTSAGWKLEGVAFYSSEKKEVEIRRQFNPVNHLHNYSYNKAEIQFLGEHGWKLEGTAWFARKTPPGAPIGKITKEDTEPEDPGTTDPEKGEDLPVITMHTNSSFVLFSSAMEESNGQVLPVKWTSENPDLLSTTDCEFFSGDKEGSVVIKGAWGYSEQKFLVYINDAAAEAFPYNMELILVDAYTYESDTYWFPATLASPLDSSTEVPVTWITNRPDMVSFDSNIMSTLDIPGLVMIIGIADGQVIGWQRFTIQETEGAFLDVSDYYDVLNTWRTDSANWWYWNADNTTKTTFGNPGTLKRSEALEKMAQVRAEEAWAMKYVYGTQDHVRNSSGTPADTIFEEYHYFDGYSEGHYGENLAWGSGTTAFVMDENLGWPETNQKYEGQGHRRNMLRMDVYYVGIACYQKNNRTAWVMLLAN